MIWVILWLVVGFFVTSGYLVLLGLRINRLKVRIKNLNSQDSNDAFDEILVLRRKVDWIETEKEDFGNLFFLFVPFWIFILAIEIFCGLVRIAKFLTGICLVKIDRFTEKLVKKIDEFTEKMTAKKQSETPEKPKESDPTLIGADGVEAERKES